MQFKSLFALIAASSLSTRCLSAIAAPAPNARGGVFKINALGSQNHIAHADGGPPMHATQNGRLEAHWSFLVHDGDEVDFLYVDFYNGNSASPSMPSPSARARTPNALRKALATNASCSHSSSLQRFLVYHRPLPQWSTERPRLRRRQLRRRRHSHVRHL
jgi:hypothetical protein